LDLFSHCFILVILASVRLGQLGWKWEDFSPSDQQKMEVEIQKDLITENLIGFSSYLKGLLALDYPLCNNQRMKEVLFAKISRAKLEDPENSRSVSNIIYYFGKMKIGWNELPRKTLEWFYQVVEWCFSSFNVLDLSNLIYG
jgi:hypothetical protein